MLYFQRIERVSWTFGVSIFQRPEVSTDPIDISDARPRVSLSFSGCSVTARDAWPWGHASLKPIIFKKTSAAVLHGSGPMALSHLVIHATFLLLEKIKTSTKKHLMVWRSVIFSGGCFSAQMLELFRVFASMEFSRLGSSSTSKVTDSREASFLNRRWSSWRIADWCGRRSRMPWTAFLTSRRWLGALSLGPPGRSLHVTGSPVRLCNNWLQDFDSVAFNPALHSVSHRLLLHTLPLVLPKVEMDFSWAGIFKDAARWASPFSSTSSSLSAVWGVASVRLSSLEAIFFNRSEVPSFWLRRFASGSAMSGNAMRNKIHAMYSCDSEK